MFDPVQSIQSLKALFAHIEENPAGVKRLQSANELFTICNSLKVFPVPANFTGGSKSRWIELIIQVERSARAMVEHSDRPPDSAAGRNALRLLETGLSAPESE